MSFTYGKSFKQAKCLTEGGQCNANLDRTKADYIKSLEISDYSI